MEVAGHRLTLAGRVNETQMAKVDAAAMLAGQARAHFVVLLTPSALERCTEPGDWLRREIETALETKRNIVPLMLEGFDFGSPGIAEQLVGGTLAPLKSYNALRVPARGTIGTVPGRGAVPLV